MKKKAKDKENEVGSSVNISEDDEEEPVARQLQKGKRKAALSFHPFFFLLKTILLSLLSKKLCKVRKGYMMSIWLLLCGFMMLAYP